MSRKRARKLSAEKVITLLERLKTLSAGKRLLSKHRPPRLSEAFLNRVRRYIAQDPERAYRLSRFWRLIEKFGESPSQVWRAKAIGERARGLWLQSARSFLTAGKKCSDPVEALSVQTGAVDSLARAGRWKEAIRLGTRLSRGLQARGKQELSARVQVNMANAYLWADEYEKARDLLRRALPVLDGAGFREETSAGLLALSTAELFGGDPDASRQYALTAQARFRREGKRFYELLCAVNLAQEALLRGRGDEALDHLLPLRKELERFSPPESARAEEFMGYAYLALNLYDEAFQCFQNSLRHPATRRTPLNQANCHYGLGMSALHLQRYALSARHFRKAQQMYSRVNNPVWEAEAWRQLILLSLITGRVAWNARLSRQVLLTRILQVIRAFEKKGAPHHLAGALLTYARVLLHLGKHRDSRCSSAIRRALKIIRRQGYRTLEWEAHFLLAKGAKSRRQRIQHYRQMIESLWEARLFTVSTLSRATFLRDKAEALQEYFSELLREATPARVREALDVISRARFSALYDELVHAQALPIGKREREILSQLRERLLAILGETLPGAPVRSRPHSPHSLIPLQKEWVEVTRSLKRLSQQGASEEKFSESIVFAETAEGYHALIHNRAFPLPITKEELCERSDWLRFELLAPLTQETTNERLLNELLSSLWTDLVEPWYHRDLPPWLSPEGYLWSIPWQALLQPCGWEPILLPNPLFRAPIDPFPLPPNPRVVVWASRAPDLPMMEKEIQAILQVFPNAKIFTTLRSILEEEECSKIDLLHVVGHATYHSQNPMFSHLPMEDANLTASEIAHLSIRPGVVVLSACDTGVLSQAVPWEPNGLVRSFLALGAKAVLASQWVLHDHSASDFMSAFYASLKKSGRILKSLQVARQGVKEKHPHPFFWAPLVLFSGYARNGGIRK